METDNLFEQEYASLQWLYQIASTFPDLAILGIDDEWPHFDRIHTICKGSYISIECLTLVVRDGAKINHSDQRICSIFSTLQAKFFSTVEEKLKNNDLSLENAQDAFITLSLINHDEKTKDLTELLQKYQNLLADIENLKQDLPLMCKNAESVRAGLQCIDNLLLQTEALVPGSSLIQRLHSWKDFLIEGLEIRQVLDCPKRIDTFPELKKLYIRSQENPLPFAEEIHLAFEQTESLIAQQTNLLQKIRHPNLNNPEGQEPWVILNAKPTLQEAIHLLESSKAFELNEKEEFQSSIDITTAFANVFWEGYVRRYNEHILEATIQSSESLLGYLKEARATILGLPLAHRELATFIIVQELNTALELLKQDSNKTLKKAKGIFDSYCTSFEDKKPANLQILEEEISIASTLATEMEKAAVGHAKLKQIFAETSGLCFHILKDTLGLRCKDSDVLRILEKASKLFTYVNVDEHRVFLERLIPHGKKLHAEALEVICRTPDPESAPFKQIWEKVFEFPLQMPETYAMFSNCFKKLRGESSLTPTRIFHSEPKSPLIFGGKDKSPREAMVPFFIRRSGKRSLPKSPPSSQNLRFNENEVPQIRQEQLLFKRKREASSPNKGSKSSEPSTLRLKVLINDILCTAFLQKNSLIQLQLAKAKFIPNKRIGSKRFQSMEIKEVALLAEETLVLEKILNDEKKNMVAQLSKEESLYIFTMQQLTDLNFISKTKNIAHPFFKEAGAKKKYLLCLLVKN